MRGAGALSAKMGAAHVGVLGLLAMVQFACTSRPLALREHGAMRMPASLSSTGRRPGVLRLSGGAEVLNSAGALGLQESVRSEMGASGVAAAASCARAYLVRPRGQVRPPVQDSHHTAGHLAYAMRLVLRLEPGTGSAGCWSACCARSGGAEARRRAPRDKQHQSPR